MSVYAVFQPPLRGEDAAADPRRFAFVRDGFHFWAMIFAPLWLLRHRLWIAFLGYVVVALVLTVGTFMLTRSNDAVTLVVLFIAILMGLEASTLRRWTLSRNGWRHLGSVVADDLESAEQRFFESYVAEAPSSPAPAPSRPQSATSARGGEVIGLFPEAPR